jgi:threonine synthase
MIARGRRSLRPNDALTVDAVKVQSPFRNGVGLVCFSCGSPHSETELHTVCVNCARPIRVEVPLAAARPEELIDSSIESMWRYGGVLPVPTNERISLGEGWTPILKVEEGTFVKDESGNPTGSFKDRGMSMAVSAARLLGAARLVAPSAGNAGLALSAYGREAAIPVLVAMPDDTPSGIVDRCRDLEAEVELVDGDISVAGKWLAANRSPGDFDVSTLKEPYRVEGKNTMGYELYEQFGGELPEVVIYPTGGGTGLVGMWKAWDEMEEMGWLGRERPRLFSVQSAGCAPIVKAHAEGRGDIEAWPNPVTKAWGLRVPSPIGGFLCLKAIAETGGGALAIPEEEIHRTTAEISDSLDVDFCPEGGAAWAAMLKLRRSSEIVEGERVLVWNTGSGANYRQPSDSS